MHLRIPMCVCVRERERGRERKYCIPYGQISDNFFLGDRDGGWEGINPDSIHCLAFLKRILTWLTNNVLISYFMKLNILYFSLETDPYKHLQHSLDVWHKSKKLASTLADLAKRSPFKDLLPWIRSIVNHFWWCCSTCHGRVDKLLHRWSGILSHINNKHVWPGGRYVIFHLPFVKLW